MKETFAVDLQYCLTAAKLAASEAACLMRECRGIRKRTGESQGRTGENQVVKYDTKTSTTDLVTEYDRRCEEIIFNSLRKATPTFKFMGEETSSSTDVLTNEPTWIVDPIDGTTAFVHDGFDCCVSIGLSINGDAVVGVIDCPFLGPDGEVFHAIKGCGSFKNGRRIQVSGCEKPRKALVLMNMPYRRTTKGAEAACDIMRAFSRLPVNAVRSFGACAFQMAMVACGRADLMLEPGGKEWDVCAGEVIIREAGGALRAMDGMEFRLMKKTVVCGSSDAVVELGVNLCIATNFESKYWS